MFFGNSLWIVSLKIEAQLMKIAIFTTFLQQIPIILLMPIFDKEPNSRRSPKIEKM